MKYQVTKTYPASLGWSCSFRQWRAESHCRFIHGYAFEVELVFQSEELDHRNWVIDFGGLKDIKSWLQDTFDHKTLVAMDDPEIETFKELSDLGLIDLSVVETIGCESFAKMIADKALTYTDKLHSVQVREHQGNAASVIL